MKKHATVALTFTALLILCSCDNPTSETTNSTNTGITGRWVQTIATTDFAQVNIYDYQPSGELVTTEDISKYTAYSVTYEGDDLVAYMDSIGRQNPSTSIDYWKVIDQKLLIANSSDLSDADTGYFQIQGDQLTCTFGDYIFISTRIK